MVRTTIFASLVVFTLAGCAHAPSAAVDADCRHVLSPDGQPLRFCESGARITVDKSAPAPSPRLVDNPEFLANMIDRLPRVEKNEKPGSKLCAGNAPGYITIRTSDFAKMVSLRPAPAATASPGLASLFTPAPPRSW